MSRRVLAHASRQPIPPLIASVRKREMTTTLTRRERIAFAIYAAGLIVGFGGLGLYVSWTSLQSIPRFAEALMLPGALLAIVTVGVPSEFFLAAVSIANIAFYLVVPYVILRIARRS